MQTKTMVRCHLTPIRAATSEKKKKILGKDAKLKCSCIAAENVKWCSCYGNSMAIPPKIQNELPCAPALPLLSIDPKELKAEL